MDSWQILMKHFVSEETSNQWYHQYIDNIIADNMQLHTETEDKQETVQFNLQTIHWMIIKICSLNDRNTLQGINTSQN